MAKADHGCGAACEIDETMHFSRQVIQAEAAPCGGRAASRRSGAPAPGSPFATTRAALSIAWPLPANRCRAAWARWNGGFAHEVRNYPYLWTLVKGGAERNISAARVRRGGLDRPNWLAGKHFRRSRRSGSREKFPRESSADGNHVMNVGGRTGATQWPAMT